MKKWIDQQTFDELLIANADKVVQKIENEGELHQMVKEFIPEAELFYQVTHDREECKNLLENVSTGFRRNGILFFVRKYIYPKIHYILTCDYTVFNFTDNYSLQKAFKNLVGPNRIGVFSKSKIEDWVTYLTQGYRNLERLNAENEMRITKFRQRLESLPDVSWNEDKYQGRIVRKGLTYTFTINQAGYSECISLDYRCQSLDDFLALSDNNFSFES